VMPPRAGVVVRHSAACLAAVNARMHAMRVHVRMVGCSRGGGDQRAAQDDCAERRTDGARLPGRAVVSRGRPNPTTLRSPNAGAATCCSTQPWKLRGSLRRPDSTRTDREVAARALRSSPDARIRPAVARSRVLFASRTHRFDPGWPHSILGVTRGPLTRRRTTKTPHSCRAGKRASSGLQSYRSRH
jgi:hypothetical protein